VRLSITLVKIGMMEKLRSYIAIISALVIGTGLIMLQISLFEWRFIRTPIVVDEYISRIFIPSVIFAALVPAVLALFWYWRALRLHRNFKPAHTKAQRAKWVITLLLGPILAVLVLSLVSGIHVFFLADRGKEVDWLFKTVPWLTVFLLIDALVIFWIGTAFSVPPLMVRTVPGAGSVRRG